jgi:uncharacterized Zn finger protein (UPF0148 family)
MEPTDLTCPTCGATWKLIKASADRIVCPYCKAQVDTGPSEKPVEVAAPASDAQPIVAPPKPVEAKPTEVVAPVAVSPPSTPTGAVEPSAPPIQAPPAEDHSIPATIRVFDMPETDDPGLADDYDDQVDPRYRRRGMNPVAKTILVLILLIFLAPVALFLVLIVVCAVMMAAR